MGPMPYHWPVDAIYHNFFPARQPLRLTATVHRPPGGRVLPRLSIQRHDHGTLACLGRAR
jgi:hypothetical protein